MTTKGKIIVTISALVILSGAGYLVYRFVIKPAQDKKKDPLLPDAPTTTNTSNSVDSNTSNSGASNTNTPPPPSTSKYGFKLKDKLFAKANKMPVYSYPDATDLKNHVGYVDKSAISDIIFEGDSNTPGWINATARYTLKNVSDGKKTGPVFIIASKVTNLAP